MNDAGHDRLLLRIATFVCVFDRFVMLPMLVSIAHELDVPLARAVSAASLYFLAYGLMQPVWGILSTRIGLGRTMRWCMFAGGLTTCAAAFAPSIAVLAVARAMAGALFSAGFPSALIYVGETVAVERRQRAITGLMTGVALGTAGGTAFAGAVTWLFDWRWGFAMTGALAVLTSFIVGGLKEAPRTAWRTPFARTFVRVLSSGWVWILMVLGLVDGAALLGVLTFIPAALESTGHSPALASAITAGYGLAVLVAADIVGRLSTRIPPTVLIGGGAVAGVTATGLLAWNAGPVVAAVACALLGVAWASVHSSLQTWVTEIYPKERGLTVSLFSGSLFAGSAVTAALGGPGASSGDFRTVFTAITVVMIVLGVGGVTTRRSWDRGPRRS